MDCFDLIDDNFRPASTKHESEPLLPSASILLSRTPFTYTHVHWHKFYQACVELKQQIGSPSWVFIDACWDPFTLSNEEIEIRRKDLESIFKTSKICILSAKAQHYYDNILGCIYYPQFLTIKYPELNHQEKRGRIGCLNRRNAWHRVWLMHHLLDANLISPDKDVYSIKFTALQDNQSYYDVDTTLGIEWFNQAQMRWPKEIATHHDNFINDYSIDHPAWHTGIVIITETEPGKNAIICEKTAKGILSKSCFSIYTGDVGYRVLEDLGFLPRFFPKHAEDSNIKPILRICQDITTESQALEYRQMHIDEINHNFEWFGSNQLDVSQRPWYSIYATKLRDGLERL